MIYEVILDSLAIVIAYFSAKSFRIYCKQWSEYLVVDKEKARDLQTIMIIPLFFLVMSIVWLGLSLKYLLGW